MTEAPPPTSRARRALLSTAAIVLLGTVLLWVGTRGTVYSWETKSLPGERGLSVWVGGGQSGFHYVDLKRYPASLLGEGFGEGFESFVPGESYRAWTDEQPAFGWATSAPGRVNAWCPVWFPGTLVGGLLLGWGLLCRRQEE